MAGEVGGAAWLPFLVAFVVATLTAFSYLELVTKYPQAAGAALYTHKAFGIHFVTFLVAFAVMCSGITSRVDRVEPASPRTSLAGFVGLGWHARATPPSCVIALAFMFVLAADQPARCRREREVQRRADADRDVRACSS